MKLTLRALAVLLGYPSAELQAHVGEIRAALAAEAALTGDARGLLEPLLTGLERDDLLDLQSAYSELFDRSRSLSLHLFEHVHGDSRERGQAMIDLGQQYLQAGFYLESTELPDFVPVFLEFVSCLPAGEAREMLGQPAHVYAALADRLARRRSPYAGTFQALLALAGVRPDAEAVAQIDEHTPAVDPPTIDEEWEEAPVTFNTTGAHEMGGPTGVVAKIRAGNRAVSREADR
ncbi:MAG: nitrate reductase molybdenum cofactor assembly chaperone [Allosphingosinicella sp.]